MKKLIIIQLFICSVFWAYGQEQIDVFSTSRIINGHSTKTLEKGTLEFRVEHKFGDMFGQNGGFDQFFGLDVSSDIRIAFEYGWTDQWMIGLGRNKGAGPITGLLDGFVKREIMTQKADNTTPFSMAVMAGSLFSYVRSSNDFTSVTSYPEFRHRFTYTTQLIIARQFFDRIGFALSPTYLHRNLVTSNDQNGLFSLGTSAQLRLTDKLGLIVEYYHNLDNDFRKNNYANSFSGAIEWRTFGHVFSLYLSNARGFSEGQFIPYTPGNWFDGEFRMGFAIVRKFEL